VDGLQGVVTALEGPNESHQSASKIDNYAEFEADRTRRLAERGFKSVIGNFSTGQPQLEDWEKFYPALEAVIKYNGFLGLHEYSAPTADWMYGKNQWSWVENRPFYKNEPSCPDEGDTGWLTFRYRKVYRALPDYLKKLKIIITECLIDGGVQPRPGGQGGGWHDFGNKAWHLGEIGWYDRGLISDDYIAGATLFQLSDPNYSEWEGFNVTDMLLDIQAYGLNLRKLEQVVGPITEPVVTEPVVTPPVITPPAAIDMNWLLDEIPYHEVIHSTPYNALQSRIMRDNMIITSNEFETLRDGVYWVAQCAEDRYGVRRVYYARHGEWDKIECVIG
jgi:hypothetical protein